MDLHHEKTGPPFPVPAPTRRLFSVQTLRKPLRNRRSAE